MNAPKWLKPGIYGAVTGAVFVSICGFTWGGWVTGGTSTNRAVAMARNDVVMALAPVCLEMAKSDPERAVKLASIRSVASYRQRDALMAAGWATVPGAKNPDRDIAKICLEGLDINESPTRPDNASSEG